MNLGEYPFITLPYKEFFSMNDLCPAVNRRISARKNSAFQLNHSMELGRIYISSPIDDETVILIDNLCDVLGFKQNLINGRSAGSTNGMDHVIFVDYPPGLSSDGCVFLYASFVETSRVSNSNVPSYVFLNERRVMVTFIIAI